MGIFKEYENYDGLGLANLVKKKEISPSELCETAIEKIEKHNPQFNPVVTKMYDQGRQSIQDTLPDGPFTGVPFLLKDKTEYAGVPMTNGCRGYKDYIPAFDSELVKRYKKSGVVILGKTNLPEFGLHGYTEPELHGATRNPWNPDHTPGGSSGGSSAAVAAGMVPFASGGDGGGSIRIPSSCCGLFGLKPSRGRVPNGPEYSVLWQGAVAQHIISRSVRDSAAMLDATCGADRSASYNITEPVQPYMKEIEQSPGKLTIAMNTVSPVGTPVDSACVQAVEETAKLLEKLGHHVEQAAPEIDGKALAKSYLMMYFGEIAADIEQMETFLGRKATLNDVELATMTLGMLGRTYSAGHFVTQMRRWDAAARIMGEFHCKYDLYLTPTTAYPPAKIGELKPRSSEIILMKMVNALKLGKLLAKTGIIDQMAIEGLTRTPFTQLANFTGQPAMSVPLFWTEDGLPCGVQFIAPSGDEATLFRLAAQLEKEKPWFDKRPDMKK